jgi:hypothetical protein
LFRRKFFLTQFKLVLASTVSKAIKYLTLNLMIKGLNPPIGTGRDNMPFRVILSFIKNFC